MNVFCNSILTALPNVFPCDTAPVEPVAIGCPYFYQQKCATPAVHDIQVMRGDAYDGNAWPKLCWNAGQDIDGKPVKLTVRKYRVEDHQILDDVSSFLLEATGTGEGSVAVVSLTSSQTQPLPISIKFDDLIFDVSVEHATDSNQTIAVGNFIVAEDQTR